MSTESSRRLLWVAGGFAVWAGALLTLYAAHAVGCAFAWPLGVHRLVLVSLLALHLAALVWMTIRHRRRWRSQRADASGGFLEYLCLGTAAAALGATLFTLAPSLVLQLCI